MFLIEISRFITERRLIKLRGEIMRNVPFGPIKEHTCPSGIPQPDLLPVSPKSTFQRASPMCLQGLGVQPPHPTLITALLSTRHGVHAWNLAISSQHRL